MLRTHPGPENLRYRLGRSVSERKAEVVVEQVENAPLRFDGGVDSGLQRAELPSNAA